MKDEIFIIPEEVKSEFKLTKNFYLTDLYVIVASYFIFDIFSGYVYTLLRIPYTALSILFGIIITRKSRLNPDKRIITSFIYRIIKSKQDLSYIRTEERGKEENENADI